MASEKYNACVVAAVGTGVQWDSAKDFRVLLLADDVGLTFDATHATVADVLAVAGNNEPTDVSYARVAITQANRSVVTAGRAAQGHILAAVDFGALANTTVGKALVYEHVTTDADSIPIVWWDSIDFPAVATGAGFTINQGASGVFQFEGVTV